MVSFLSEFALSQSHFQSLCHEDKLTLLRKNLPLYLQYIISRYFHSRTGLDQLSWMLEGHLPIGFHEEIQSLRLLDFEEVNRKIRIFDSKELINEYEYLMRQVADYFPLPHNYNALLVNIIIYYENNDIKLSEPQRIRKLYAEAKDLLNLGQTLLDENNLALSGSKNLDVLIRLLERMSMLFGTSPLSPEKSQPTRPETLNFPFTDTEEMWLQYQLDKLQRNYRSVYLPVEFLDEYIKRLNGVNKGTPSKTLSDTWFKVSIERARLVLNTHTEFLDLSSQDQCKIWLRNHMSAVALTSALLNTTMSGKQQFKGVLGIMGKDQSWEDVFTTRLNINSLFPVKLAHVNKNVLDESSMK